MIHEPYSKNTGSSEIRIYSQLSSFFSMIPVMASSLPDPPLPCQQPLLLHFTPPFAPLLTNLPKQQLQGISGHSPVGIPTSVLDWCHCDLMVVLSQAVQGQTKKIFFSSSRTKYKKVSYLYLEIYSQLCPLHTDIFSMVDALKI